MDEMEQWLRAYPPRGKDLADKTPDLKRPPPSSRLKLDPLDLHGYTKSEAENILCQRIDRLPPDRRAELRVVHGKGLHSKGRGAVLAQLVREVCRWHPRIERSSHPPEREGGRGVTILHISTEKKRK